MTEQVNAFTMSLLIYPVIVIGLLAYRAGRVGPGFWALVSGSGAVFVSVVHFGPAAVEPPELILGHYDPPILGWLAFGWLATIHAGPLSEEGPTIRDCREDVAFVGTAMCWSGRCERFAEAPMLAHVGWYGSCG